MIGNINDHISTNINSYKYIKVLCDNDIHTLQNGRKKCDDSPYYCGCIHISDILWWQEHWFWVIGNRNEHISTNINPHKYIKSLCDNDIYTLQNGIILGGWFFMLI